MAEERQSVWVVVLDFGYDGEDIHGIYSTRERAESAAKLEASPYADAVVKEFKVQ